MPLSPYSVHHKEDSRQRLGLEISIVWLVELVVLQKQDVWDVSVSWATDLN